MKLIHNNLSKILQLCKIHKVETLSVFGSVLTDRFNKDSDIDFSVTFKKNDIPLLDYADNYFDLVYSLEDLFGRKVDLICEDSIHNPIFLEELDSTKQRIYG